jgi:hypothetical protein
MSGKEIDSSFTSKSKRFIDINDLLTKESKTLKQVLLGIKNDPSTKQLAESYENIGYDECAYDDSMNSAEIQSHIRKHINKQSDKRETQNLVNSFEGNQFAGIYNDSAKMVFSKLTSLVGYVKNFKFQHGEQEGFMVKSYDHRKNGMIFVEKQDYNSFIILAGGEPQELPKQTYEQYLKEYQRLDRLARRKTVIPTNSENMDYHDEFPSLITVFN